jgi:hypothetical protein
MKMCSDCSGPCKTCYSSFAGGCIAGHGDDHYHEMTWDLGKELLKHVKKYNVKDFDYNRLKKAFPGITKEI